MNDQNATLQSLIERIDLLTSTLQSNKQMLSIDEAAVFTGLSVSYLYKLTSTQEIPHYKPRGKIIYFDRLELEEWLRQGRISSQSEIQNKASDYTVKESSWRNNHPHRLVKR